MTRSLYANLYERTAWCQRLQLSEETIQELEFWVLSSIASEPRYRGYRYIHIRLEWSGENNWWFSPVCLVPRIIRHAQRTKACGTLI